MSKRGALHQVNTENFKVIKSPPRKKDSFSRGVSVIKLGSEFREITRMPSDVNLGRRQAKKAKISGRNWRGEDKLKDVKMNFLGNG